jgi:hypothetical protein
MIDERSKKPDPKINNKIDEYINESFKTVSPKKGIPKHHITTRKESIIQTSATPKIMLPSILSNFSNN